MKRVVILTVITFLGAGAAFAGSLFVPWFLDNGSTGTSGTPTAAGTSCAFITITNTTGSAITCTVTYRTPTGVDATPVANTFSLPMYQAVSWRPAVNDTGPGGSEGPAGGAIPDMTSGDKGSARISWPGGTSKDIQGRVAQILPTGNALAYLLPEGP
ncbi:MAG TPA: hypothetical protein HPP83_09320 [Candidatus Hydrogenedentes bacterium]|nr:hypothetical protein [Candidatus Hydrogenedentota bacterium]